MFKWCVNTSTLSQSFFNMNGDSISVEPNGVFDFTRVRSVPPSFAPVNNFLDEYGDRRFYIQRRYALGDVLTGIPVVRWCRANGYDAVMRVPEQRGALMRMLDVPYVGGHTRLEGMPGLILDWVLERDHTDPNLGKLNRTHIFFKALGAPELPKVLDWSADSERFPEVGVDLPERYVVMCAYGSNVRKQLPKQSIERVIGRLNARGIHVVYNGDPDDLDVSPKHNTLLGLRLGVRQLFTAIAGAAALVTVDTALLWIGHFTATPTVAILGPSAVEQRLMLHPLWPEGVVGIMMNEWIGCATCCESGTACQGQYKCLNLNGDRLAGAVTTEVAKFYQEQ